MGSDQLEPGRSEGTLVLGKAGHPVPGHRLMTGTGQINAPEIEFGAALPNRQLQRTPAKQVKGAGMGGPGGGVIGGMNRAQAPAVPIQDQAGDRHVLDCSCLEKDQVTRLVRCVPPTGERGPRGRRS